MSEVELVNLQRAGVWLVEWNGDSFKAEDVTPPQAEQKAAAAPKGAETAPCRPPAGRGTAVRIH